MAEGYPKIWREKIKEKITWSVYDLNPSTSFKIDYEVLPVWDEKDQRWTIGIKYGKNERSIRLRLTEKGLRKLLRLIDKLGYDIEIKVYFFGPSGRGYGFKKAI